jgi:hypothetical protein
MKSETPLDGNESKTTVRRTLSGRDRSAGHYLLNALPGHLRRKGCELFQFDRDGNVVLYLQDKKGKQAPHAFRVFAVGVVDVTEKFTSLGETFPAHGETSGAWSFEEMSEAVERIRQFMATPVGFNAGP